MIDYQIKLMLQKAKEVDVNVALFKQASAEYVKVIATYAFDLFDEYRNEPASNLHFTQQYAVVPYGFRVAYRTGHIATQVNDGMRFDTAFLFALLRQATATLQNVLKQRYSRGVHRIKPLYVRFGQLAVR
jgi:hypothetical protein